MDSPTTKELENGAPKGARVLFVTTVPITLVSFLIPLAKRLIAHGAHVDCASQRASEYAGLSVFEHKFDITWSRSLSSMLSYSECEKQIFSILDNGHYDIVHVHTPIAAYITRKACARWKVKHASQTPAIIYTVHGFHFYKSQHSMLKNCLFRTLEKRALPWTDALVVMNDEDEMAARALQKTSPATRIERIDGIGFDFSLYASARMNRQQQETEHQRQHEDMRPTHLCIIAEHNENKDISLLFEAVEVLKKRGVSPFNLTVVGSGPLTENLKAQAVTLGVDSLVTFTGQLQRGELDEVIKNTDVGILVSKREGLPRSLMEFCAAGVMICGTSTRGIIDEVRDPRALALERTAQSVANMLQPLIESKALRDDIAREQYEHAQQTYDLPLILNAYQELYAHYLISRNA